MSYLGHLCLFAYSSDQHILCCVFGFFLRLVYSVVSFSGFPIFDFPFGIL